VIRVSVEVRSEAGCLRMAVWAESIEQAVSLAGARYPGGEAEVLFPIDSEAFFTQDPCPASATVLLEAPESAVG
jgi:hypothetical protein